VYKEVVEATLQRSQDELQRVTNERDKAMQEVRRAEGRAQRDRRAAMEQARYVKELSVRLTQTFGEAQNARVELEASRATESKAVARARRDRAELEQAKTSSRELAEELKRLRSSLESSGNSAMPPAAPRVVSRPDERRTSTSERRPVPSRVETNDIPVAHEAVTHSTEPVSGGSHVSDTQEIVELLRRERDRQTIGGGGQALRLEKADFTESLLKSLRARQQERAERGTGMAVSGGPRSRRAFSATELRPPAEEQSSSQEVRGRRSGSQVQRQRHSAEPFVTAVETESPPPRRRASTSATRNAAGRRALAGGAKSPRNRPFRASSRPDWGVGPGRRMLHSSQ